MSTVIKPILSNQTTPCRLLSVFFLVLVMIPNLDVWAQSFDAKVKDLTDNFQPQVKGLNDNFQPGIKDLSGNPTQSNPQSTQNNPSDPRQTSSSPTQNNPQSTQSSPSDPRQTSSSSSSSRTSSASSTDTLKADESATGKSSIGTASIFTCSRCGVEGAQTKGYCLGNFGMMYDKNGKPFHHIQK